MKYEVCLDTGYYFMNTMEFESEEPLDLGRDIEAIMLKATKLDLIDCVLVDDLDEESYKEYEDNCDSWLYIDLTMEGSNCYFVNIENFRYKEIEATK